MSSIWSFYQEAIGAASDRGIVASACPFCMTMMEDGINARKGAREMRVMDIAEVLLDGLESHAG